jgi:uncharacterized protein (TIGR02145 family)
MKKQHRKGRVSLPTIAAVLGLALTLLACEDKEKKQTPAETQTSETEAAAETQQPSQEAAAEKPAEKAGGGFKTVKIGNQTWMAENLNYEVKGSKCGGTNLMESEESFYLLEDENTENCDKYGRLYKWATAMALPSDCNDKSCASQISEKHKGICPSGWHIPSNADWNVLMKFVDPSCSDNSDCAGAGTKLKTTSGWEKTLFEGKSGNGTDDYGFAALPGGEGYSGGDFRGVGNSATWWSASEGSSAVFYTYIRSMSNLYGKVSWYESPKVHFFSIRCIQN